MEKPLKFAFSDEAKFKFLRAEILIPAFFIGFGFFLALVTMEGPFDGLGLSAAAMSVGWLGWVGLFVLIAWGHRLWEKRAINRMFAGDIWECWQFSASEWQAQVEAVCNLISPKEEGLKVYEGVVASSIFGLILALILTAVSFFAFEAPELKITMRIVAVGLFLFMIGVGLYQPMAARKEADRYRHKALLIKSPRVWFAANGIYHETLGHTSLKELHRVTDQTRSRKAIRFTLVVSSESYDDLVKIPFPVPRGCEERASKLVRRYREEILQQ